MEFKENPSNESRDSAENVHCSSSKGPSNVLTITSKLTMFVVHA